MGDSLIICCYIFKYEERRIFSRKKFFIIYKRKTKGRREKQQNIIKLTPK